MIRTNAKLVFATIVAFLGCQPISGQSIRFHNGTTQVGKLLEIRSDKISAELKSASKKSVNEDWSSKVLTEQAFLRWGHPTIDRELDAVVLTNGSILACIVDSIGKDQIKIVSRVFDIDVVPIQWVRGIIFRESGNQREKQLELDKVLFQRPTEPTATLINGDISVGRLGHSDQPGTLVIKRGNLDRNISFEQLQNIRFPLGSELKESETSADASQGPNLQTHFLVGLNDGTQLVCREIQSKKTKIKLVLSAEFSIEAPLKIRRRSFYERVNYFQPANTKMRILSTFKPLKVVEDLKHSFRKTRMNRAADGGPLISAGIPYDFGIGTQGPSQVIFAVEPKEKLFRATVAFNDSKNAVGNATVRVLVLKDKWQPDVVRFELDAKDNPRSIEVDVSGCRAIGLVTSLGKRGAAGDQVNWLDARIYK